MQVSVRSYLTAGVATVGACAIALSPVSAPLPDIQIPAGHQMAVDLSAFQNPIEVWAQVIGTTITNLGGLGQKALADPLPMLAQILANQVHGAHIVGEAAQTTIASLLEALSPANPYGLPAQIQKAAEQIAAGDIQDGFVTAFQSILIIGMPIIGMLNAWPAVAQPFKNLSNLVSGMAWPVVMGVGLGALQPFFTLTAASGALIEDLIASAKDGDPITFLSTVINAPAVLTGAFLNGTEVFGYHNAGLLDAVGGSIANVLATFSALADLMATPGTDRHNPFGALAAGSMAALAVADDTVVTGDVSALPADAAQTVTLSTGTAEAEAAPPAEAPPTPEAVVAPEEEPEVAPEVEPVAEEETPASTPATEEATTGDDDSEESEGNSTRDDSDRATKSTEDRLDRAASKSRDGDQGDSGGSDAGGSDSSNGASGGGADD